jgi:hypothetical protein
MEDVLNLYEQPYDSRYPVICFDERPCQLIGDTIAPIPMKPGNPKREDYEYARNGTCCVFVAFEPHAGKRIIRVRKRRTKEDYAKVMKEIIQYYPEAESIRLVQDNLNTHTPGSFYKVFSPQEAFDLAMKFECHYTPKKGSWLNMAEIEISALSKQCLDRRIDNIDKLAKEIAAWEHERNEIKARVRWQFNKVKAREKLHRHYISIHN